MTSYQLDESELKRIDKELAGIDKELASKFPLNKRILEAINRLCPEIYDKTVKDGIRDINHNEVRAFWEIYPYIKNWYQNNYPKKSDLIGTFGYKPFLLNENIYNLRIIGQDDDSIIEQLPELTDDMPHESLNEEEISKILNEHRKSFRFFMRLNILEYELEKLTSDIGDLLAAGIWDIHTSLSAFQNSLYLDAQPVMFASHQATEKFLKALLVYYKEPDLRTENQRKNYLKELEHNLEEIRLKLSKLTELDVSETVCRQSDFNGISEKITELQKEVPSMDIRYKSSGKTPQDAIKCIDLMMDICLYVTDEFLAIAEMSEQELESLRETLSILSDESFSEKLQESMKQVREGKTLSWETAKESLGL